MFGYDAGALIRQPVQRILASRQDDPFAPAHRHHLDNGQTVLVTFRHKDGFFFTAIPGLRMEMRDSDQAANATISLKDSGDMDGRLLRLAEQGAGFGRWELDMASNEISWSEGVYRLLELRPGTELSPEQALFYCQVGQNRVRALFRRCMRTGRPFSMELSVLTSRQRLQRVILSGRALKSGGRIQKLGGVMVNHSEAMLHDHARQQAQRILEATAHATPDLVVAVDTSLNLLHFNAPWAEQFRNDFGAEPRPGDNLKTLLADFTNERRMIERLWQRAFDREHFVAEMPLNRQGEALRVDGCHFQHIQGLQAEVVGAVHVAKDISNRVQHSGSGDYRMRHDPVTGLMNRRSFVEHLERAMKHKRKRQSMDGLLLLDLDSFEQFNEQAGSGTCDRYLRELAGMLGLRVRQRDALARLSGDTFALFIENCPEPGARRMARKSGGRLARFRLNWRGGRYRTQPLGAW